MSSDPLTPQPRSDLGSTNQSSVQSLAQVNTETNTETNSETNTETNSETNTGPLRGLRVIELASEAGAYAGKLLADFGAEVLLVEPPGGHHTRTFEPIISVGDSNSLLTSPVSASEQSLWFAHYNTSKLSVELDLNTDDGATKFRELLGYADIVLESEPIGRLASLGLDYEQLKTVASNVVWGSVTSFGRNDPRSALPSTNLTVVAAGGMAWSCGYDDVSGSPPMAALGNQGYQTGSLWAAVGIMMAIRARTITGRGQLVDASLHAAVNVTTEQATQWWLIAGQVVRRQTGRHASYVPTDPTIFLDRDGREVHTGFPPRHAPELVKLLAWIDELELRAEMPLIGLIELAVEQGGIDLARVVDDELVAEMYRTVRDAVVLIASKMSAREFFVEGQTRGFAVGMVLSPDEVMIDEHLVARGYPALVYQPQINRSVLHPGLPIRFTGTPGRITHAPTLGSSRAEFTSQPG